MADADDGDERNSMPSDSCKPKRSARALPVSSYEVRSSKIRKHDNISLPDCQTDHDKKAKVPLHDSYMPHSDSQASHDNIGKMPLHDWTPIDDVSLFAIQAAHAKKKGNMTPPPDYVWLPPRDCDKVDWSKYTNSRLDLFEPLAQKALQHFNSSRGKNWTVENVIVATEEPSPGIAVHMNFMAKSDDGLSELFFAELKGPDDLDVFKFEGPDRIEHFKVYGCCLLQKSGPPNSSYFPCGMCCFHVQHPGLAYGYFAAEGDQDCKFYYRVVNSST